MGQAPARKVGMKDVAEVAGISISAVSMALADSPQIGSDTKKRVRDICRDLGYPLKRPGSGSRRRRATGSQARRMGFLTIGMNLHDESLASLLHGLAVQAAARKIRFEVSAAEGTLSPAEVSSHVREFAAGLDGVMISGIIAESELLALEQAGIRYVVIGHVLADESALPHPQGIRSVICDNLACGRAAATWLIQRGHRRLGFFCERAPRGMYAAHWQDGFRLGHEDAGLTADASLFHIAGKSFAGGEPAARHFAGLANPPTAYVCPDVRTASSFLEAMRGLGRGLGPEQMVLGGLPVVATRYGLEQYPLLSEDSEAIAEAAMDLLSRVVEGTAPARSSVVVPFLSANFS